MIKESIRKINVDLITGDYNPIIEWFDNLWNKLLVIEIDVFHSDGGELVYYLIEENMKKIVFFRDDKNDKFWYNVKWWWWDMDNIQGMKYDDKESITRILIENRIGNSIGETWYILSGDMERINERLNERLNICKQ